MKAQKSMIKFLPLWLMAAAVMLQPATGEAAEVAAAFTPGIGDTNAEQLVIETIDSAQRSIRLAAYVFTSKTIARALVDAKRRGVEVQAILDKTSLKGSYNGAQFLANSDIPVRIDSEYATMHNKFMVVDMQTVQTGSFNYSQAAAQTNAENVIVVRDHAAFAKEYDREWQRLWRESEQLPRKY